MTQPVTPESPDEARRLSQLLREWKQEEPLPPRFTENVWRRITLEEAAAPANFWHRAGAWGRQFFQRPSFSLGYVTVLLLAGLFLGHWQARVDSEHTRQSLESRYLQMMAPYQAPRQ